MAIGRISGQMLYNDLERQGINLAFDSNLLYLDVVNRRVGVKNTNPLYELDISGTIRSNTHIGANFVANALTVTTNANIASNTTITSTQFKVNATTSSVDYYTGAVVVAGGVGIDGNLNVRGYVNTSNLFVNGGNLTNVNIGNITFTNTTIGTTNPNTAIILDPSGTGYVLIASNVASTSYSTGALVVAGGAGIDGNLNVNGAITTSNLIVNGGDLTNVNIGNITFSNTTITTKLTNGNITLSATGTGLVQIAGSAALALPAGNTAQSPTIAPSGAIRYNTDITSLEFFNGVSWVATTALISVQEITPDGSSSTYTLNRSTTAAGAIVNLNGVIQRPDTAYTVTGTQITFTEVPQVSDIIEIRFLSTGESAPSTGSLALISNIAPAHSNSTGAKGQVAYDSSYFYVCVDTNTWIRTAITNSW